MTEVDGELLEKRLVQAERFARAFDHVVGRLLADEREHGVDRDHPADEEGHREQAEVGHQDHRGEAQRREDRLHLLTSDRFVRPEVSPRR